MRGPADVFVWEASVGSLVMATHNSLTHKTHASHHKDREDNADDGADGAGVTRDVIGG